MRHPGNEVVTAVGRFHFKTHTSLRIVSSFKHFVLLNEKDAVIWCEFDQFF